MWTVSPPDFREVISWDWEPDYQGMDVDDATMHWKTAIEMYLIPWMWMMRQSMDRRKQTQAGIRLEPHEACWAVEEQGLLDQLGHRYNNCYKYCK